MNADGAETEVQNLIATYIERWNARDYDGMADMFTEPVTYVVPGGTTSVPNRAALIDKLKAQFADMESKGFDHTVLGGVDTNIPLEQKIERYVEIIH